MYLDGACTLLADMNFLSNIFRLHENAVLTIYKESENIENGYIFNKTLKNPLISKPVCVRKTHDTCKFQQFSFCFGSVLYCLLGVLLWDFHSIKLGNSSTKLLENVKNLTHHSCVSICQPLSFQDYILLPV